MRTATAIKATASVTLVGLILWWVGPAQLLGALASVRPGRLLAIGLLALLFILARAWKWAIVARAEIPELSYWRSVTSLVGGMGLGMVTPARAGEFSRALFLPEGDRVALVGLFTFDRVVDLLTIVAFGVAAAFAVGYSRPAAVGAVAVAGGIVATYGLARAMHWVAPLAWRVGGRAIAERLIASAERLGRGRITATLASSVVATGVGYLQFFVILDGFVHIRFPVAAFAFSAMILSNLLPVSIAGLGVREWVSVLLLREYGVSDAVAVNAAFLSYLVNTVAPGLVGAVLFARVPMGAATHHEEGG